MTVNGELLEFPLYETDLAGLVLLYGTVTVGWFLEFLYMERIWWNWFLEFPLLVELVPGIS